MSTNLYWEPLPVLGESLPDSLKFILREKVGWPVSLHVTESWRGYFDGLASAKVDGAKEVLELLDKYGEIRLMER